MIGSIGGLSEESPPNPSKTFERAKETLKKYNQQNGSPKYAKTLRTTVSLFFVSVQ